MDDAVAVGDPDVLLRHTEVDEHVHARDAGGAGTGMHDLDLIRLLADYRECIDEGGAEDDRGTVLVVVEDRDLHALAQRAFDDEAFRCLDVLEVDAAEARLETGDDVDQLLRIRLVDLDVEDVDAGELLEQHALAFHDRFGRQRADVAEAEHGGTVGDDRDEVAARGHLGGRGRVADDLLAGVGDAGRVGQRELALGHHRLGRHDLDLAGWCTPVVVERSLLEKIGIAGHGVDEALQVGDFIGFSTISRSLAQPPARVASAQVPGSEGRSRIPQRSRRSITAISCRMRHRPGRQGRVR